jgi:probable FeS assembly SUF system protein SufT
MERRLLVVQRDCQALLVPAGTPVTIPRGTFVTLTQEQGGSYTVVFNGNLARIDGVDADALGLEPLRLEFPPATDDRIADAQVWQVLRSVYDPEIPVNIVDLGLVHDVAITQPPQPRHVHVRMTLTAPACGMGPVLVAALKSRLLRVPNVDAADVELVFDPPWDRSRLSDEARLELGLL